jgi:hypothetical protein
MPPRLDLTVPHHPAVIDQFNKRAQDAQLRIADQITRFAGSMAFVYLHIALFTVWMLFIERSPWPDVDAHRLSGGDFSVDLRHDRAEPAGRVPTREVRSRFRRAGNGTSDQHRLDPGGPYADQADPRDRQRAARTARRG